MKQKKKNPNKISLFWCLLFLMLALAGTNGQAKAEEKKVLQAGDIYYSNGETIQTVEQKGDCYYIRSLFKKEVTVIGIRKGAKNPEIPDIIDGKKVREIWLESEYDNEEKEIDTLTLPRYAKYCSVFPSETNETVRIKNYNVHPKNKYFSSKRGCLYSKDGKTLKEYPNGDRRKRFTVPEGIKKIGSCAFMGGLAEKVILPDSVKTIDGCAFADAELKSIRLPSGLKTIDGSTFKGCKNLQEITLPKRLKRIGVGAFERSGLREITFPKSLEQINMSAFEDCKKLRKVTIPKRNHLVAIEEDAFRGCSRLKRFIYPQPIQESQFPMLIIIEANAFRNCIRLEKVELSEADNMYIEKKCFYNCKKLKEIQIKSSEVYIDEEAFVKKGKKKKLTIIAPKNSYAYNYAKKHRKQGLKAKALK